MSQVNASLPLVIRRVKKSFQEVTALNELSLELSAGKVLALLGPSGCGKTTLLRCIAGLLNPDAGEIVIGGHTVNNASIALPPEARNLGMVFQDYALWPHMTVAENVSFPLEMQKRSKAERKERVQWALATVGLSAFADRSPDTLSGGQQQRVALARAIVSQPRLLLMDEPLSNLDKGLRESLAMDIRRLINDLGLAAVFVTHDQHEAFALADSIAVMQQGRLEQIASPQELYEHPANPGIAKFLDAGTLVSGLFTEQGFTIDHQSLTLPVTTEPQFHGRGTLMLPRKALTLNDHPHYLPIAATVNSVIYQGEHYSIRAIVGVDTEVLFDTRQARQIGQQVELFIDTSVLCAWGQHDQPIPLRTTTPASSSPSLVNDQALQLQ